MTRRRLRRRRGGVNWRRSGCDPWGSAPRWAIVGTSAALRGGAWRPPSGGAAGALGANLRDGGGAAVAMNFSK